MIRPSKWLSIAAGTALCLSIATAGLSFAQNGNTKDDGPAVIVDPIPDSVMQTKEGRELATRLKVLRKSQASMGKRHPGQKAVQAEIDSLRRRLGIDTGSDMPIGMSLDTIDDNQMRQLIRRMALRIESLERRVDSLERRLQVF